MIFAAKPTDTRTMDGSLTARRKRPARSVGRRISRTRDEFFLWKPGERVDGPAACNARAFCVGDDE
jgi:hypothetical protein